MNKCTFIICNCVVINPLLELCSNDPKQKGSFNFFPLHLGIWWQSNVHLPTVQIFILFTTLNHCFRCSGITENQWLTLPNPASPEKKKKILSGTGTNFREKRVVLVYPKRLKESNKNACMCIWVYAYKSQPKIFNQKVKYTVACQEADHSGVLFITISILTERSRRSQQKENSRAKILFLIYRW